MLGPQARLPGVACLAIVLLILSAAGACTPAGPAVMALRPHPDSAMPVAVDRQLHLVFDRPMDQASLADAVAVAPALAGDLITELSTDGTTLALIPRLHWQPGTAYQVAVTTDARDRDGRPLKEPFSGSFTTSEPRQVTCMAPRVSPDGELVAWVEHDGTAWQCWVAKVESPEPRLVYDNLWPDSQVEWLDDTALLAVLGANSSADYPRVGVISVLDGQVSLLPLNDDLTQPGRLTFHVSPDGSRIVVQNDMYLADAHSDFQRQLGVAFADGTGFRPFGNLFLSWGRDSSYLLWLDLPGIGEGHSFDYTVYQYEVDTGISSALSGAPLLNNFTAAARCPDGTWIAFGTWTAEEVATPDGLEIQRLPRDIWLIDHDGANMTQFTANQGRNIGPQWLTAQALVFASDRAGGEWDVWLVPGVNEPAHQINLSARTGYDGEPQRGPGGDTVVFVSDASGAREIWLMSSDGSTRRMLSPR